MALNRAHHIIIKRISANEAAIITTQLRLATRTNTAAKGVAVTKRRKDRAVDQNAPNVEKVMQTPWLFRLVNVGRHMVMV